MEVHVSLNRYGYFNRSVEILVPPLDLLSSVHRARVACLRSSIERPESSPRRRFSNDAKDDYEETTVDSDTPSHTHIALLSS